MRRVVILWLLMCQVAWGQSNCQLEDPNWDWEDFSAGNYTCHVIGHGEIHPIPPFLNPDGIIDQIAATEDYTKDKGWVLVRKVFGCPSFQIPGRPYFVLYNKYTGLLRLYQLHLSGELVTSSKSVLIYTPESQRIGSLLNYSKPVLEAADKYPLSNQPRDYPIFTHERTNPYFWLASEFQMAFDPDIDEFNSRLRFLVDAINEGEVRLDGTFSFETFMPPGYQVVNTTENKCETPLCNTQAFLANGAKALKGAPKIFDEIRDFGNNAKISGKFVDKLKTAIQAGFKPGGVFSNAVAGLTGLSAAFSTLSKITDVFVGLAKKKRAPQQPVQQQSLPMISRGDITLKGTITTDLQLFSATLQAPGSRFFGSQNRPYYNCPLGIYTLKKTPVFRYGMHLTNLAPHYGNCVPYSVVQLAEPPELLINGSSGLVAERIEVALQLKLPKVHWVFAESGGVNVQDGINILDSDRQTYMSRCGTGSMVTVTNPHYMYFEEGKYIYNGFDTSAREYHISTRYVDLLESKNLAIAVPMIGTYESDIKKYVRGLKVRIYFRDALGNLQEDEQVFHSGVFAMVGADSAGLDSPSLDREKLPECSAQQVVSDYREIDHLKSDNREFDKPFYYEAMHSVCLENNVKINAGKVTTSYLLAPDSIIFRPGVTIGPDNDVVIGTKVNKVLEYKNSPYVHYLFTDCNPNEAPNLPSNEEQYKALMAEAGVKKVNLGPNPIEAGKTIEVKIDYPSNEALNFDYQLYDVNGRLVLSGSQSGPEPSLRLDLPYEITKGIYILKITNRDILIESKKIIIQ
ncbi:MAG TPA: T9SS type A sorting domain-containing protein [Luteibaculaceae bacterium]|nr:T9SS type A sorting domain-containing protein [Luteibaculaceae bacterium]